MSKPFFLKIFVSCARNTSRMYSKDKKYARKNVVPFTVFGYKTCIYESLVPKLTKMSEYSIPFWNFILQNLNFCHFSCRIIWLVRREVTVFFLTFRHRKTCSMHLKIFPSYSATLTWPTTTVTRFGEKSFIFEDFQEKTPRWGVPYFRGILGPPSEKVS